ncbi:hypothetical protein L202_07792 [Cryptococcus amylolentus CBS 6039]|uniref:Uncharacterized protein n=1 Tax=Cryptococcus amylolentus CBS 6039 TaxID=1295533 RepID=A0A1E3HAQ2_9TREE|nr:hypothetical protein L202_07792 [Cryptococcus amylolentus CBS 6039]ODN73235.1 hypothetical protein L202_07792 [Cryptococcus amylolentus CBS 6039]
MAVHGNLSHAMRDNYNEHGVDEYYRKVAASYRNPFFPGIKKVVWTFMNKWWEAEGRELFEEQSVEAKKGLKILDMAAGSGEATICLLDWAKSPSPSPASPVTPQTPADPLAFLRSNPAASSSSRPAFVPPSRKPVAPPQRASASSSGAGRKVFGNAIPPTLPEGFEIDIMATDPYTSPAYSDRTSRPCHPLSFTDLAQGQLPPSASETVEPHGNEPIWDIVICSFALHLVTDPSELFALLYELSGKARWLVIVAPHKKPEIKETWGWSRWDIASWSAAGNEKLYAGKKSKSEEDDEEETALEIVRDKTRLRVYRSNAF